MEEETSMEAAAEAIEGWIETQEPSQPEAESDEAEQPIQAEEPEAEADETEQADEADGELAEYELEDGVYKLPKELAAHIEELKNGSLKEADYRKKTMELAEQRKALDQQLQSAVEQHTQQLKQELEMYRSIAEQQGIKEPDKGLLEDDPVEYLKQLRSFEEFKARQGEQQQQQLAQRQAEVQQHNRKLLEANPEWADPAAMAKDVGRIKEVMQSYGFSDAEISNTVDHRAVNALKELVELRAYKASMEKQKSEVKQKVIKAPAKALRPGTAQQGSKRNDAMATLQRTGKLDDAAAAIMATL